MDDQVPAGIYLGRAVETDEPAFGRANTGSEFVQVWFQIEQQGQEGDGPYHGRFVKWTGWLTPNTGQRTVESLALCGARMERDDVTDLVGIHSNLVRLTVELDDRGYSRVAWVNDPNRPVLPGINAEHRLGPQDRARLAAEMKGMVFAAKQAGGAQRTSPTPPQPRQAPPHARPTRPEGTAQARQPAPAQTAGQPRPTGQRPPAPDYRPPTNGYVRPEDDGRIPPTSMPETYEQYLEEPLPF